MAPNDKLVPDQQILSSIFPDVINITENAYDVISNTFETCTFRIRFKTEPQPGFPKSLLIRLEKSGSHLAAVTMFQRLGHLQLPDIVPLTLAVGTITNSSGRELEYSIVPYLDGTCILEDVWNNLKPENQQDLMDAIVYAVEKLQNLDLRCDDARRIIAECGNTGLDLISSTEIPIGGRAVGHYPDVKHFLVGLLAGGQPKSRGCEISDTTDGIVIQSAFDDLGYVELNQADLDDLQKHTVLCHSDLEPRNILVKQTQPDDNGRTDTQYELVALIDWEMAGFYPFAYEYGLKDTLLGSSNLSLSWYSLFKERTAFLLPTEECHSKLVKAIRIIAQSKDKRMTRNVGVRFKTKWIERERVKMSPVVRHGWVREDGVEGIRSFTKQDHAELELEVLKELGYI